MVFVPFKSQFPPSSLAAEAISSEIAALSMLPVFFPVGGSLARNSATSNQVHVMIFHVISPKYRPTREKKCVPCA